MLSQRPNILLESAMSKLRKLRLGHFCLYRKLEIVLKLHLQLSPMFFLNLPPAVDFWLPKIRTRKFPAYLKRNFRKNTPQAHHIFSPGSVLPAIKIWSSTPSSMTQEPARPRAILDILVLKLSFADESTNPGKGK